MCTRPMVSVAGTRCTRWMPASCLSKNSKKPFWNLIRSRAGTQEEGSKQNCLTVHFDRPSSLAEEHDNPATASIQVNPLHCFAALLCEHSRHAAAAKADDPNLLHIARCMQCSSSPVQCTHFLFLTMASNLPPQPAIHAAPTHSCTGSPHTS